MSAELKDVIVREGERREKKRRDSFGLSVFFLFRFSVRIWRLRTDPLQLSFSNIRSSTKQVEEERQERERE